MSDIGDSIIFKKGSGNSELKTHEKYVGLKSRQGGILTVNFRAPEDEINNIKDFFSTFSGSERIKVDIGGTGDIECYYRGMAPVIANKDEAGFEYFFLSVTLQELVDLDDVMDDLTVQEENDKFNDDDMGHECVGCGFH